MYSRRNRWSKNRVPDRVCERLQHEQILRIKIEAVFLDSALGNVHPDGTGNVKKQDRKPSENPEAVGPPSCLWLPRMPNAHYFPPFPGNADDAPQGQCFPVGPRSDGRAAPSPY